MVIGSATGPDDVLISWFIVDFIAFTAAVLFFFANDCTSSSATTTVHHVSLSHCTGPASNICFHASLHWFGVPLFADSSIVAQSARSMSESGLVWFHFAT